MLESLPDPDWPAIARADAPVNASHLSYPVRVRDAVPGGAISLPGLADICQEAAARNAAGFGQGLTETMARGAVWVMSRMRLAVRRYPRLGETVTVDTWPAGLERRGALRVYRLGVADEPVIGAAISVWSLFDLATRRPVAAIEAVLGDVATGPCLLPVPPTVPPTVPASPGGAARERAYPVHPAQIDVYGHVNHTHLIAWCLGENAGADGVAASPLCPRDMVIGFRAEARPDDTVVARRDAGHPNAERGGRVGSALTAGADGREIARAVAWYGSAAQ
ncbi:acyl-[acyl-carrier-protein] thioesterase [Roseospira marina]|uniref:acyl-[acyl-carrier-protein] thioesterase n=1 Tax=Roseospira marina TaxID=140057 RepID=UPI001478BE95|nr:acyl-ACP thioesterase domain-containing protein [Roseospira marina]MBB4314380.1 acyl-ACP thioesterase [Roseospira marina]MBB5087540.1 acyl-ACP thioesterase [Roseospira marina]